MTKNRQPNRSIHELEYPTKIRFTRPLVRGVIVVVVRSDEIVYIMQSSNSSFLSLSLYTGN